MKREMTKEIIWLSAIILGTVLLAGQLVGFRNLCKPGMDIQLYDIYILFERFNFLYPVLPLIIFCVYLIRSTTLGFNNVSANIILIISTIIMIIFTTAAISMINELMKSWFVIPEATDEIPFERSIPEGPMLRIRDLLIMTRIVQYLVVGIALVMTIRRLKFGITRT